MENEVKYYNFKDILKFIGIDYEYTAKDRKYPFNWNKEDIKFSWGQILIPKHGIQEMVQNKISDIKECPIKEIKMMYQIPFVLDGKTGIINKDISLSFRYDKEFKYGKITKSIYECCFWILQHSKKTNEFYIITDDMIFEFFNEYIIHNQWGLGALSVSAPVNEKYEETKLATEEE